MVAIDLTSPVALYSCTVTNPARRRGSTTAQPRAAMAGSITFGVVFSLSYRVLSLKSPLLLFISFVY
ncbi:hypothetical protein Hanom_Chr07g00623311 [Helianthus anomalus]